MLLIAQMTGQLRMQAGLQHPLHQLRQKPALPGQLHPAFINPVHQLIQEPLVEELINRLLRRPLRTVSPRHNVHPVPRFLRSVYTDNLIPPEHLPNAQISVDPFHLVQLANLMVTRVRQRLVRDREHRRGRKIDPAWAHRTLLLRGYDTLSGRGKARLQAVFDLDDLTDELSAAWGVKEQLRRLLKTHNVEAARHEKMILGCYVLAADMEESRRLWTTIDAW